MHELSIALSVLDVAEEEAQRNGGTHVAKIHIRLGPLSGVVKEALLSAFELAREGTDMADCALVIVPVPIVAFCPQCQADGPVVSMQDLRCAQCGTPTPRIISGRELQVSGIEIT